jgi:membrane fusion protein, multidrug efflux system
LKPALTNDAQLNTIRRSKGFSESMVRLMPSDPSPRSQTPGLFFRGFWFLGIAALLIFAILSCTRDRKSQEKARTGIPVTAAAATRKDVPVQLRIIGNVEAYATVSIKALVDGQLWKVHFKEGQDVQKEDLLFSIDARPFEATLRRTEANLERDQALAEQAEANLTKDVTQIAQAEANLAKDVALAKNAETQEKRYAFLAGKNYVSKDQYDQMRANYDALSAAVQADKAAVENARASLRSDKVTLESARAIVRGSRADVETASIQLGYCSIRAPISGRTGGLLVQQGNMIKANDVPISVINQISPIYVTFALPEQNLAEIKKHMAAGPLKVEAFLPDEEVPERGILTFVDNAVDTATGTIKLKGTFENKEKRLWPGQFLNVVLTLTTRRNAVLVPSQAIQTGQEGPYVFVLKPDLVVEARPVTVDRSLEGMTVVARGLQPGETVVTDGHLRLVPGGKVEIKKETVERGKVP